MIYWIDTESIGFCGPTTLIQYLRDDGTGEPTLIPLDRGWLADADRVAQVRRLLDDLWAPGTLAIMFNGVHDWFKLCQVYHEVLGHADDSRERPVPPPLSRTIDLQIHAALRSPLAPFVSGNKHIGAIRRIPREVGPEVAEQIEERLRPLVPPVLGLIRSEHQVAGRPDLVSYSWVTEKRIGLKTYMRHYGIPTLDIKDVWPLVPRGEEIEIYPYLQPCTRAIADDCYEVLRLREQTSFWSYAYNDPIYTWILWDRLGQPTTPTHLDTITQAVGYARYKGFDLDQPVLGRVIDRYRGEVTKAETDLSTINLRSPKQRVELLQTFDPLIQSSAKKVLEEIIRSKHPAAEVAESMRWYGVYKQRLHQAELLAGCRTGRAHVFTRVLGTASGRPAGAGGFNMLGIEKAKKGKEGIRSAIIMTGNGDFDGQEITIAPVAYNEPKMQAKLDAGDDLHIDTACMRPTKIEGKNPKLVQELYRKREGVEEIGYQDVLDARNLGKTDNFASLYGAEALKLAQLYGVTESRMKQALEVYYQEYPGIMATREQLERDYCTADTTYWDEHSIDGMKDYAESLFGFRRSFSFEKAVATTMWKIGKRVSQLRLSVDGSIVRTGEKGIQTYRQAIQSACLGAAINIQSTVKRAAGNHRIQATGVQLTNTLHAIAWEKYRYVLLNVYDELGQGDGDPAPMKKLVKEFISVFRAAIPSLSMEYNGVARWSEK